jgi:hypothetical protein
MNMVPVRIPCEDFLRLRLAIARWHQDRSLNAIWDYYPLQQHIVFSFDNQDIAYEFMVDFEDA